MRIGISVISHAGQNIWENGLGQNVVFLACLFQRLPFVDSVLLIDVGDQNVMPSQVDLAAHKLRMVRTQEATDLVDVIVEMAGALDVQWLDWMRARGKKVVSYCCGQPYVGLIESAVFGKTGHAPRPDRCDEVWVLPKDAAHAPMLRVLQRCEVREVPYVWHPMFIEQRVREVERSGYRYGYVHGRQAGKQARQGFRVAIFEPNISVVKNAVIPMLICDEAYRADRASVEAMHVLNTLHVAEHPTMLYLANSLDLVRQHRATFHGRHDIAGFMVQHADAVVAHQWCNDQNYSYLDALWGNYPLIHNSPWLKSAGYFYPGFDARAGAGQLQRALAHHDEDLESYRAQSQTVFRAVDPFEQANLSSYAQRLRQLCQHTSFAVGGRS